MAKAQNAFECMELCTKRDELEQLLGDICHNAFKHEVQYWKDAPGTDAEKLDRILVMAREALALVKQN